MKSAIATVLAFLIVVAVLTGLTLALACVPGMNVAAAAPIVIVSLYYLSKIS